MILQQSIVSLWLLPAGVLTTLRLPKAPPEDWNCLLTVASRYLHSGTLLSLCPELSQGLHRIGKWALSASLDIDFLKHYPFRSTIICPLDENDLGDLLDFLTSTWQPKARFMVVVLRNGMEHDSLSEGYLQQLWERKTLNAAVLIGRKYFEVYSMSAFDPSSKCGSVVTPKLTNVCYKGMLLSKKTIFPDILKNLNGCPIRVSTLAFPPFTYAMSTNSNMFEDGIEIRLLDSVARKINATIVYITVRGDGFLSDPWGQMLSFLVLGDVDIGVSHFAPFILDALTISESYFGEVWSFAVPSAGHSNDIRGPLSTLSTDMKLAIGGTFVILRVISQAFHSDAFHLWAVLIGLPIPSEPPNFGGKALLLSWLFTSLVIRTAVVSSFFTSLAAPLYEKDLSTIEELLNSGLKFGGHWARRSLFCHSKDDWDLKICRKYQLCILPDECYLKVATNKNFAYLSTDKSIRYKAISDYTDSKGVPLFVMLKERVWTTPVVAVMKKPTIFLEKFNWIVRNLLQGGFLVKFERDMIIKDQFDGANKRYSAEDETQMVTLGSLAGVFIYFAVGNGVAIITFFIEILVFKCLKIRTVRNIKGKLYLKLKSIKKKTML